MAFTEQRFLLNKCSFLIDYNSSVGFLLTLVACTDQWWQLLIRCDVNQSAGDITVLQCRLLIRGVLYNPLIHEIKNKMVKTDPKKVSSYLSTMIEIKAKTISAYFFGVTLIQAVVSETIRLF